MAKNNIKKTIAVGFVLFHQKGGMCISINEAGNGHGIAVFTKQKQLLLLLLRHWHFVICAASPIPHFRRRLMQMNELQREFWQQQNPCRVPCHRLCKLFIIGGNGAEKSKKKSGSKNNDEEEDEAKLLMARYLGASNWQQRMNGWP